MAVVLTDAGPVTVAKGEAAGEGLWLSAADAERATGWTLKPEGMCRAELCVPLPEAAVRPGAVDRAVDVAAFWRKLGNPVLHDDAREAWVLGTGAQSASLASLEAPDFVLPDLAGTPHRLSELRGRKVFLVSWAPW
jgi:hypothetical protein